MELSCVEIRLVELRFVRLHIANLSLTIEGCVDCYDLRSSSAVQCVPSL